MPASSSNVTGDAPIAAVEHALLDRQQLSLVAFERTRMPMVMTDPRLPDNPIVLANRAFYKLCGYEVADVIGRNCRFLQGPETDQEAVKQIRDAVAAGSEIVIELLNYHRTGRTFWNELYLSPIHDDNGKLVYYFASQFDVTEERKLRELETAEHRLLREIDHRAKNALALVQGIVRLTRADDAAEYSRGVQGRVDALAHAHIILSDAQWQDVPLGRVIAGMVGPFGVTRVSASGPELPIGSAQVQPLVLLLHELFANAAQHGGLSVPEGKLTVTWRDEAEKIVIELVETGGPMPQVVRTPGFGLTMVDAFVRRQLRGDAVFAWPPEGLRTVITIPRSPARTDKETAWQQRAAVVRPGPNADRSLRDTPTEQI